MAYDDHYDEWYVLDGRGNRIYAGDYVRCSVGHYESIRCGEHRRVQRIENECIILNNCLSPHGTSPYRPHKFVLHGRYHPFHGIHKNPIKKQEAQLAKNALYIAVALNYHSYGRIADAVNGVKSVGYVEVHADTSFESLKAWLNQRIRANPEERWLILSGTTLAEISAPPVSFRSV
jgi:hypothetical protein